MAYDETVHAYKGEFMRKKGQFPINNGRQLLATGSNQKYDAPLFDTLAIADGSQGRDPSTNVAIPSDDAVLQAKKWVDDNRL